MLGGRPSYSNIAIELNLSRPTARKRIKELIATGHIRESKIGHQKLLELTQKGFNLFIQN
jgi:DNA-binding Lrp family transcriptional regulator